jgi:quercetin dioxygenase-like cupin family protein
MAAAPEFHRVLLENKTVRVLETRIEPGQVVPLHTHRWPAVYYSLSRGEIVRRDQTGRVEFDSRLTPLSPAPATWAPPLSPHTLENVGATVVHVVSVEVKGGKRIGVAAGPSAGTRDRGTTCAPRTGQRRNR